MNTPQGPPREVVPPPLPYSPTPAPAYTPFDPSEQRPFGNDALDRAVRYALAQRNPGHDSAFVAFADGASARIAVGVKAGEHWSCGGFLEKPWKGELTGGVQVVASW